MLWRPTSEAVLEGSSHRRKETQPHRAEKSSLIFPHSDHKADILCFLGRTATSSHSSPLESHQRAGPRSHPRPHCQCLHPSVFWRIPLSCMWKMTEVRSGE